MKVYLYRLRFSGPTHFGDTGIDLENVSERVSSDTLFSALVNTIRVVDGETAATDMVNEFLGDPPFLISSLFLYSGDKLFMPRPISDDRIPEELRKTKGKELKKLSWVTTEQLLNWVSGKEQNEDDIRQMSEDQHEYRNAFKKEIRPRVSLSRSTQNSNIYHCGYVYFKEHAGLYGLAAFKDQVAAGFFKRNMEILGSIGLGGEKTYGSGMFTVVDFMEVSGVVGDLISAPASMYVLLSLYHPSAEEVGSLEERLVAYDIVRKKGWVSTGRKSLPLKKKSAGFFTEGSVLGKYSKGCLVDVTPETRPGGLLDHKVYRYGYAFTVPMGGANVE